MREHGQPLRTVLVNNTFEFCRAFIKGLVPADSFPLRGSPFAHVFHGVFQLIRIVEHLDTCIAAGTDRSAVVNGFRIAFQLDKTSVSYLADKLTAPEAHFTDTTCDGLRVVKTSRLG